MLSKYQAPTFNYNLDKLSLHAFPMPMQPIPYTEELYKQHPSWLVSEKLDGFRVRWDGFNLLTRGGFILDVPVEWKRSFTNIFPNNIGFEAELYAGIGKLHRIPQLIKSGEWGKMTVNIFDLILDGDVRFSQRYSLLQLLVHRQREELPWLKLHPYYTSDMKSFYTKIIEKGGEGVVLRLEDGLYTPGKHNNAFLKLKYLVSALYLNICVRGSDHMAIYAYAFQPSYSNTYEKWAVHHIGGVSRAMANRINSSTCLLWQIRARNAGSHLESKMLFGPCFELFLQKEEQDVLDQDVDELVDKNQRCTGADVFIEDSRRENEDDIRFEGWFTLLPELLWAREVVLHIPLYDLQCLGLLPFFLLKRVCNSPDLLSVILLFKKVVMYIRNANVQLVKLHKYLKQNKRYYMGALPSETITKEGADSKYNKVKSHRTSHRWTYFEDLICAHGHTAYSLLSNPKVEGERHLQSYSCFWPLPTVWPFIETAFDVLELESMPFNARPFFTSRVQGSFREGLLSFKVAEILQLYKQLEANRTLILKRLNPYNANYISGYNGGFNVSDMKYIFEDSKLMHKNQEKGFYSEWVSSLARDTAYSMFMQSEAYGSLETASNPFPDTYLYVHGAKAFANRMEEEATQVDPTPEQ